MINWFKGLFGFPTKSEVIRDTILTLAKDRTLLESALSLSDEMDKHKAKITVKPELVPVAASKCVDATARIAELAAKGMKYDQISAMLTRDGFFYQSKQSNGLKTFEKRHIADLINGVTIYSPEKGFYVSSWRTLNYHRAYEANKKVQKFLKGKKK
jgi:hypothetical protein